MTGLLESWSDGGKEKDSMSEKKCGLGCSANAMFEVKIVGLLLLPPGFER